MNIADPDDLYPIDLADAPPGAPADVDYAVTELHEALGTAAPLDPKSMAAYLAAHPERWRVADDDAAEWAMARLAEAQQVIVNDQARLREYQRRLATWFETRTATAWRRVVWWEAHLRLYALGERAKGRKSFGLPSGRVATRGSDEPDAFIDDDAAVLAWAEANRPDLVKRDPSVLVSTLRTALTIEGGIAYAHTADGERVQVPGVIVKVSPPIVTITT